MGAIQGSSSHQRKAAGSRDTVPLLPGFFHSQKPVREAGFWGSQSRRLGPVTELGPPQSRAGATEGPESSGPMLTGCHGALASLLGCEGPSRVVVPRKGEHRAGSVPLVRPGTGGHLSAPLRSILLWDLKPPSQSQLLPDDPGPVFLAERGAAAAPTGQPLSLKLVWNQLTGVLPLLCEALGTGAG